MGKLLKTLFAAVCAASAVWAVDVSVSGFATIGGAISDKPYNYQRFINNDGTLKRDSVFGLQTDITLNEAWSATIQGKAAPSTKNDTSVDATLTWAFLSYRPTDDWLIRVGKLRAPVYLNNENMDVGVTYNMARLPLDMYSLTPIADGVGLGVTKSFFFDSGELLLDAYWGKTDTPWRVYMRDDLSAFGGKQKGADFETIELESKGIVATFETNMGGKFRAGLHKATTHNFSIPSEFALQPLYIGGAPTGMYSYQPKSGSVKDKNELTAFTLGADIRLDDGYRLIAEYGTRSMRDVNGGFSVQGGYLAALKTIGKWTPYIGVSTIISKKSGRELYLTIDSAQSNPVTAPIHRQIADTMQSYDQKTYMFGASYNLTPTQKIKAELAHTAIGSMSSFIDNQTSARVSNERFNVYSISYSVSF
ncbi:MAG TPA: hypothetical protein PLV58_05930 [Campylobacterales bacterium]|nr:hypothetical protein [Campylobacterales bacterium]